MNDIAALAAAGCRFVRLARREKRPLGAAWQTRSTDNPGDVAAWLAARSNVGLLLGPPSGVVDVEFDDDDGRATLERLGLVDVATPTWRSARGEHRLFRWTDNLPPVAVAKIDGLEVRIGGRAAQSVLPPSLHPDGQAYAWTTHPTAVEIAAFPLRLMEELCGQHAG
jgi:hypothetical protein